MLVERGERRERQKIEVGDHEEETGKEKGGGRGHTAQLGSSGDEAATDAVDRAARRVKVRKSILVRSK